MTTYEVGRRYERQVLRFLLAELSELNPKGETNTYIRGLAAKQPYEADISLTIDNGGFPRQVKHIWVECRWREQGTIKRDDISSLVYRGQDSVRYAKRMGEWHFNGLMFVSNRPFHADAISIATHEGVGCLVFDGRKAIDDNRLEDWLVRPRWIDNC